MKLKVFHNEKLISIYRTERLLLASHDGLENLSYRSLSGLLDLIVSTG